MCEHSFIKPVEYYVSVASYLITGSLNLKLPLKNTAAYIFEKKLHILISRKMSLITRLRVLTLSRRL